MAEKPADPAPHRNATGDPTTPASTPTPTSAPGRAQEPSRAKKKPSKKPRAINKDDISLPSSVEHFYHMGPTDAHGAPRGLNMQLPTPCPGKVNDQTDSNISLSPGCPVGSIIVKQSVIDELKQEINDLRTALTEKADHIARRITSLTEGETSLVNKIAEGVRTENEYTEEPGADGDDRGNVDREVYQNSPIHTDGMNGTGLINPSGLDHSDDPATANVVNLTYGIAGEARKPPHALSGDGNIGAQCTAGDQATDNQTMLSAIGPVLKALPASLHAKADVRECLSHALRVHCPAIIENVVFRESELPDELIADNCITEDECCDIRQRPNRRDQVRLLLSAVRGRDVFVLDKLLARIKRTNADIAAAIQKTYTECMGRKVRSTLCSRCMLKERVNVKYVCDNIMAIHAIGEGLYNEIIYDSRPAGAQDSLWNRLLDSLNSMTIKDRKVAFQILADTLIEKHYKYIQDGMKGSITYGRSFECQCHSKLQALQRGSDPVDTFSPRSSTDASRPSSRDSGELLSDTYRKDVHSGTEPRHAVASTKERRYAKCGNLVGSLSDMDVPETISENKEADNGDETNADSDNEQATTTPSSSIQESTYV